MILINYYRSFCAKSVYIASLEAPAGGRARSCWTPEQERAFRTAGEPLASARSLAAFDSGRAIVLITAASPYGLGAALAQREPSLEERHVALVSWSLTFAKKNYCRLEDES